MGRAKRQAILYQEAKVQDLDDTIILTKGTDSREAEPELKNSYIDVMAGRFEIGNLPDFGRTNEVYLEISLYQGESEKVEDTFALFKYSDKVKDNSTAPNFSKRMLIEKAPVQDHGITLQCKLTEIDAINSKRFKATEEFVKNSKISELLSNTISGAASAATTAVAGAGIPVNISEILEGSQDMIFETIKYVDEMNEDDPIWLESPYLDTATRDGAKLYDGYYAFVTSPFRNYQQRKHPLPDHLFVRGGIIYNDPECKDEFDYYTYITLRLEKHNG